MQGYQIQDFRLSNSDDNDITAPISFTPASGVGAAYDPGHCQCNSVTCGYCQATKNNALLFKSPCCTIGSCAKAQYLSTVPIKTLIEGSVIAPWVRLRFEGTGVSNPDSTEITTGNLSQPGNDEKCRAAIKSFQYGWGALAHGNLCRITIVDEAGASFSEWVKRLYKNPSGATMVGNKKIDTSVYKMKVQWGWIIEGNEDGGCPSTADDSTFPLCKDTGVSPNPRRIICSPVLWFIPDDITVNMQTNGKFVYEITGVDALFRATENANARIQGEDGIPAHFEDAVTEFADKCLPQFNVSFLQYNPTTKALTDKLQYFPEPNVTIATPMGAAKQVAIVPKEDIQRYGPKLVWRPQEYNPLQAILSWLQYVKADTRDPAGSGKGLTCFYDSTFTPPPPKTYGTTATHGRLIICRDELPTGCNIEGNVFNRCKALYVVNGGKCSSVFSFTPQMKWRFLGLRAGGYSNNVTGTQYSMQTGLSCAIPGTGKKVAMSVPSESAVRGDKAAVYVVEASKLHRMANVLHHPIEAELRVQGDPSDWLCTPQLAYGRNVALIVINPFSLTSGKDCPEWSVLNTGSCNEILTNRAWFILGADHQIREGSYVTTLKIVLLTASADSGASDKHLGVIDPNGFVFCPGSFESSRENAPPRPGDIRPNQTGDWTDPANCKQSLT